MGGILEDIKAQLDRIELRLAKCEADGDGMVDQHHSPLGPRKHCEVVRRLIAEGDSRAQKRNKRYLMTADAVRQVRIEEMRTAKPANTTAEDDVFYADLMKEVRS